MKRVLTLVRWFVGILFIFSGLIKANDPLGLSYKMQEFFEVWGWHGLNDYTLTLSVLMIAFEIIAGVAVIVAWRMRLVSWLLLLLIIFFTFLTAYAQFSGKIKTCGCFGDCIPLTANQSFWKDIILTILILFIFLYRNKIKPVLSTSASIIILVFTTVFSFGSQWYVLQHLPVLDCLPYKTGNNIAEKMKVPAGSIPDSIVINFVYTKAGKEVEFSADAFPEDFDESIYTFVKRYDKVVRKGNAEAPIKDFSLTTLSGTDTTSTLLSQPGYTVLFFVKDAGVPAADYAEVFRDIQTTAALRNIGLLLVTADATGVMAQLQQENITMPVIAKCDAVAIKTAARTNPTMYILHDGNIVEKWGKADLNKALKALKKIDGIK